MTQPTNKRFVMEDKLTTELALKAPKDSPTFTGGVNISGGMTVVDGISVTNGVLGNPTIQAYGNIISTNGNIASNSGFIAAQGSTSFVSAASTTAITNVSTTHAMQAGPTAGFNVRLGTDGTNAAVQAVNNGAYSTLDVNALGGNVAIGSASTTTSVLGTFTPPRGYLLVSRTVSTTSPAAFTKATYPWLRAIKVICVGGGGGGGGAAITSTAQNAIGQAGAGGAYAETFITDIAGLASSVTLTVGAGGTAGAAGGAGGTGGDTSFGALCVAKGGTAGTAGAATAVSSYAAGANSVGVTGSVGDIIYSGGSSGTRQYAYNASVIRPISGGSFVSQTGLSAIVVTTTAAGATPAGYGVGGLPGINAASQGTAIAGGAGAGGLMIVELYA